MTPRIRTMAAAVALFISVPAHADPRLEVVPSTFDFGWAPDNAKITAQFVIRNTGSEPVPLTAVLPTCGCTAADFTPGAVGTSEETKIALTFNTRGYTGVKFRKPTRVKTDVDANTYVATLTGHVANPDAKLIPEGDGIAEFPPEAASKKQKIVIVNKSDRSVTLKMVQAPAEWASASLPSAPVAPGQKATIDVSVDGSVKEARHTSFTIAPADSPATDRATIAVRTGPPPPGYRIAPRPPKAKPQPAPARAKPSSEKK